MSPDKFIITFFIFISIDLFPQAQDTVINTISLELDNTYIKWVNQFPSLKLENEARFKDRFVDLIFGSDRDVLLNKPVAVMATNIENYWILDQGNGTIFRIQDQLGEIPHYRNKTYKIFTSLVGICSIPGGKIILTDSYLNKLFLFTADKKELVVLNDSLPFDRPTGVAYSSVNHEIWVVETNAHRISVLSENGQFLRRIGSRGSAPGEFNFPTSVWIDKFGKVFIVDAMNFRVQVFSKDGDIISVFGKLGDATGYFARPKGIATDSEGNIYVADALFHTIQIFDMAGNFLYNFGKQGHDIGEFWMPSGIYIDEHDFIYVADTYNSRVQVFQFMKEGQK